MRWAEAVSAEPRFADALAHAAGELRAALAGAEPQLLFAFVAGHPRPACDALPVALREAFPGALLLGCGAESVLGAGREIEDGPGLALSAAALPGAAARAFHVPAAFEAGDSPRERWRALVGVPPGERPHFVLLADPRSCDAEGLVRALDEAFPGSVKVGGLASGGAESGAALFLDGDVRREGAVGVALWGDVELDAVVAQGCRPVGHPLFVTRCRENVLLELDGRPPLSVLGDLYAAASPADRALFQSSLFLGIEMRPAQGEYGQGDFLVRNLIGGDEDSGALAVAAGLRQTQVVQFHLRDARTAAEDLERRLVAYGTGGAARGALLFSCLGRGRHLYGVPDHDSGVFRRLLGDVPLAGFFCNGEIGPVGDRTFLHGYTSAFGIFRARG